MLRKFMHSTSSSLRLSHRTNATTSNLELDLNVYHEASDRKLEELSDKLEEVLEDRFDTGADVSLNNGVLTVAVDDQNTYVINKQTPNRQLWLSSPISGPKRFDYIKGEWVEKHDKIELGTLIDEELRHLLRNIRS